VRDVRLTSEGWHVLRRTTFDYRRRDGRWETQERETYDRGNGAVVLPYDTERGLVLLTRQFRATRPTSTTTRTGCSSRPRRACSTRTTRPPPYTQADRTGAGGGAEEEGEDTEVLELPFTEALAMTLDGRIADGKTVLLLQWAALHGPFAPPSHRHGGA
jgi:hypothetical protein